MQYVYIREPITGTVSRINKEVWGNPSRKDRDVGGQGVYRIYMQKNM